MVRPETCLVVFCEVVHGSSNWISHLETSVRFDHLSTRMNNRVLSKAYQAIELLAYSRVIALWRTDRFVEIDGDDAGNLTTQEVIGRFCHSLSVNISFHTWIHEFWFFFRDRASDHLSILSWYRYWLHNLPTVQDFIRPTDSFYWGHDLPIRVRRALCGTFFECVIVIVMNDDGTLFREVRRPQDPVARVLSR